MTDPCEHDPAHYTIERYYTTDMVRIHIRCEHCGALGSERRPPQTIVEHLRCLSQAVQDVARTAIAEIRRAR